MTPWRRALVWTLEGLIWAGEQKDRMAYVVVDHLLKWGERCFAPLKEETY